MPRINSYEITVEIKFRVGGALAYHEAVRAAEARASKALKGDGPAYSDPVSSAEIASVAARQKP